MPRKSRDLRMQQAKDLLSLYSEAGVVTNQSRFINDMIYRMQCNKGLSPRQRQWLDNLIEEGVPTPKNPELYDRIMSASKVKGLASGVREKLLNPFANIALNGWRLSEAQERWLGDLLDIADNVAKNGPWRPEESQLARIRFASDIAQTRGDGYWMNRPGESKAAARVASWLEVEHLEPGTVELEEWHVKKLLHSSRVALREYDNPSFHAGEIRGYKNSSALILSGPHPGDSRRANGRAVYEVLVDGNVVYASVDEIKKRVKF